MANDSYAALVQLTPDRQHWASLIEAVKYSKNGALQALKYASANIHT
jgi:hypothetical protein